MVASVKLTKQSELTTTGVLFLTMKMPAPIARSPHIAYIMDTTVLTGDIWRHWSWARNQSPKNLVGFGEK